jgi:hypothetical protein
VVVVAAMSWRAVVSELRKQKNEKNVLLGLVVMEDAWGAATTTDDDVSERASERARECGAKRVARGVRV